MSDHGLEELNLLNKKIDELLTRYNDLKTKNRELNKENERLKVMLQESEDKFINLENRYERIKISGALLGSGENAIEAKKKINDLVREIDRCVALLNR
jgi:predicted  nucleic acid-binding Zn-ribbon protein